MRLDVFRWRLALALLLGLAVLALPDAGEPAEGTTVVLALPSLPLTGNTQLDRGEIAHLAGCIDTAVITIGEDAGRGYTVIVRCRVPVVPIADILRADPWDPSRRVPVACANPSPFTGCAFGGS